MDISGGSSADQTRVQLWQKNGTNAQKWVLNGGQLKGLEGKCLDSG
jgi:hypothetical protein